ncbi:MAG: hypothetical protein JXB62_06670 [Pirellulales bacterium]|nr:hypothetical protein [Pirellulales bacterium]
MAPGLSPGILSTGDLNLADDSAFDVEIGGTTPGDHDQLVITGSVTLGNNVTLSLSAWDGFVPLPGDEFVLIANDQDDPVTGTFGGLAEGAIVSADFFPIDPTARITYVGGDGNDVAIAFEFIPATVTARQVFYNNSAFDGNDPAANQQDDDAIAPDKQPLPPGETATFANYTGYARGINGIMVDVTWLPGMPTAADFEFRVGNDDDPAGWADAPPPDSVTVRPGDGLGGSDRLTLIWPDYAIQKQWLQVTVLATANTGLDEPDVFYFGNAVAEAGNSTTDAKVNATDMLLARNNPRTFLNPAGIDFPYDYNRDARVNATDMLLARNNQTHFLNALKLISVPTVCAAKTGADATRTGVIGDIEELPQVEPGNPDWYYELALARNNKPSTKTTESIDQLLAIYGQ